VSLSAQTHAMPFYARFGFRAEGNIYQDAGIPHLAMSFTFQESP
jgi:predicted GNAT family N-acyltransferase